MTFSELGLHEAVLKALADAGYENPTPVQAEAIPAALAGQDLMVSSQTGSGKTAAFMLPAIHRFAENPRPAPTRTLNQERQSQNSRGRGDRVRFQAAQPRMLVLTPTRELAMQVTDATDKYGAHLRRLRAVSILGGMPYPKQLQLLQRNPEILVATPGRLIDHLSSGKIDFSQLEILVLDEADRMLDMGFIEDIETIVDATPAERQTMLFSATLEGQVGTMAQKMTRDPRIIRIAGSTTKHENIEQRVHFVDDQSHKNRLLDHLLRDAALGQAVVFTATKRDADQIAGDLCDAGFAAAPLHGDMQQRARNRTLTDMRHGNIRILVATDVAARGIDVPGITHVFNYDLPKFAEDYVHRIGRTGRAGRSGIAVSLVSHRDGIHVKRIERFTRQNIPVEVVPGHEPKRPTPDMRRSKPEGWKGGGQGRKFGSGTGAGRFEGRSEGRSEGRFTDRSDRFENRPRSDDRGDARFDNRSEGRFGKPAGSWQEKPAFRGERDGEGSSFRREPRPEGAPQRENRFAREGDGFRSERPAFAREGKPAGGFNRDNKFGGAPREGRFSRDGEARGFSREGGESRFADSKPAGFAAARDGESRGFSREGKLGVARPAREGGDRPFKPGNGKPARRFNER